MIEVEGRGGENWEKKWKNIFLLCKYIILMSRIGK